MDLFRVICCIMGILIFIIVVGFFGLIISKHCVFSKEPIKTSTPVLDKFQQDVEKVIKERK
jgi:hypothetical protein